MEEIKEFLGKAGTLGFILGFVITWLVYWDESFRQVIEAHEVVPALLGGVIGYCVVVLLQKLLNRGD